MSKKLKKSFVAEEQVIYFETKLQKTQKNIKKYQLFIFIAVTIFCFGAIPNYPIVASIIILFISFLLLLNAFSTFELKKEIEEIGVYFEKNTTYFVKIGDAVTAISDILKPANVLNIKKTRKESFNPEALRYPILFEDTQLLTHMFVIGTTGAGKTTFLVNILEQVLQLGGGCMAVDGKGDQSVYEAFYNTAIDCGREDDFFVINYNIPKESNTLGLLNKGTADEITDIIGNLLEQGGDNAFWSGRALSMMKGLLSILVVLKDNNLLFTPNGEKSEILTFTLLQKWIDDKNLKKLYFTIKVANQIINRKYRFLEDEDSDKIFEEKPLEYIHGWINDNEINESDLYSAFNEKEKLIKLPFNEKDYENFSKLIYEKNETVYKGIDIDRLENYLSSVYFNITDEWKAISESSSKQHGNSYLMWNEPLDLISGRFGKIFDTKMPEIDMQDIISNGRILYILLPSLKVDPRTLSVLGKVILGFFKQSVAVLLGEKISGTVEERYRSFAIRPRIPFWAVLDEYGSYAVQGFDNVLAQARSLKVSVAILVQEIASLKKVNEQEAQRLLGNTGIKVVLKLEEQKSINEVVEFIGKEEKAFVGTGRVNENLNERNLRIEIRDILTTKMLKEMGPGHAYILWAGKTVPALVRYYNPPIAKVIPDFSLFKKNITQKYFRKYYIKDYIEKYKNEYKEYFKNNKNKNIIVNKYYWEDFQADLNIKNNENYF